MPLPFSFSSSSSSSCKAKVEAREGEKLNYYYRYCNYSHQYTNIVFFIRNLPKVIAVTKNCHGDVNVLLNAYTVRDDIYLVSFDIETHLFLNYYFFK